MLRARAAPYEAMKASAPTVTSMYGLGAPPLRVHEPACGASRTTATAPDYLRDGGGRHRGLQGSALKLAAWLFGRSTAFIGTSRSLKRESEMKYILLVVIWQSFTTLTPPVGAAFSAEFDDEKACRNVLEQMKKYTAKIRANDSGIVGCVPKSSA